MDPAEAVMPAVSSAHDVAESEYEPHFAGQTDLAPVEVLEPTVEHEAEFEEAIASVHDAELREAAELPEPDFMRRRRSMSRRRMLRLRSVWIRRVRGSFGRAAVWKSRWLRLGMSRSLRVCSLRVN